MIRFRVPHHRRLGALAGLLVGLTVAAPAFAGGMPSGHPAPPSTCVPSHPTLPGPGYASPLWYGNPHPTPKPPPAKCDVAITKRAPGSVTFGATITFSITVANVGDVPVPRSDLHVTDPSLTAAELAFFAVVAGNGDAALDPGEVWEYRLPNGGALSRVAQTCGRVDNTAHVAAVPGESSTGNNSSSTWTQVTGGQCCSTPMPPKPPKPPKPPHHKPPKPPEHKPPKPPETKPPTPPEHKPPKPPETKPPTPPVTPPTVAPTPAPPSSSVAGSATPPPVPPGKITLTKWTRATATARHPIPFRITVKNVGAGVAHDVWVSDHLPAGTSVLNPPKGATLRGGFLRWRVGDLAPGQSMTLGLWLQTDANKAQRLCNTARAVGANVPRVLDTVCTRVLRVAGARTPPPRVTG